MAVVPFTSAVNVGTGNASASWIDRTGTGNISDTNFDNDDNETNTFTRPVDRIALFSQIGQSWGGCVEARINDGSTRQYDTDDTLPDTTKPDTLFTPYFAPDEPGPARYRGQRPELQQRPLLQQLSAGLALAGLRSDGWLHLDGSEDRLQQLHELQQFGRQQLCRGGHQLPPSAGDLHLPDHRTLADGQRHQHLYRHRQQQGLHPYPHLHTTPTRRPD